MLQNKNIKEGFTMKKLDLIMLDECGDELKVDTYQIGSELDDDYVELWKETKIEKAWERYPEAQRFYFERPFSDYSYRELSEYAFYNEF